MICPKCGKEISEGKKFCTQCGAKIEEVNVNNNIINEENVDNNINKDIIVDNTQKNEEYVNNVNYSNSVNNKNVDNISNKKNNGLIITLVIVIVAIIIGISIFILWKVNSNKVNSNNVNSNNSLNTNTTNNTNNSNTNANTNSNNSNTNNNNNSNSNSNNSKDIVTTFDNYKIAIDMTMEVSDMTLDVKASGIVDQKNQIEYLKMTMDMLGMSFTTETYTDIKNGVTYVSEPITNTWIKEKGTTQTIDINDSLNQLKNMENVQKIDDNHYKIIVSNEDILGMLDSSDFDLSSIVGQISADVYTKDGYIEEIRYDFSNLTEDVGKFTMNMKISDYNKAGSVKIPDEVIKSATEE